MCQAPEEARIRQAASFKDGNKWSQSLFIIPEVN